MEFQRTSLADCSAASGVVVVIDVIRAFTTAACALDAGATDIRLVGTVDEALALRAELPGALVMGEVGGLRPEAFDLGNAPSELQSVDLGGRHLIQRTSAGTQGVVRSYDRATHLFACSLCCAAATARQILRLEPETVTFVITGVHADDTANDGDEDHACADYLEALLRGQVPDARPIIARIRRAFAAAKFADPSQPEFPAADLDHCTSADRFDFAMPVVRRDGHLVMTRAFG